MTDVYREPGTLEVPAYEWDVIWYFGMPKIHFRDAGGQQKISSDILDEQGKQLSRTSNMLAHAKHGTKIRVLSGKTYVLKGDRVPFMDVNTHTMVDVSEPEPETRRWFARVFRR